MVKKKKTKSKKKPGFKRVSFFSGLQTESKEDDRQVSFVARNLGKDSPLPRPKKAKALRELSFDQGIQMPKKQPKEPRLPLGIAESTGLSFDNVFGLGKQNKKKGKGLFSSKIGIDTEFGKSGFDADFSKAFRASEFEPEFDFPTMIEADFEDNPDIEANVEAGLEDQSKDDVPSLLESLPTIQNGSKALDELEEDDEEESKADRIDSKFIRVRNEALETGGNPLTPEEERNFEAGVKQSRNFGTTGRGNPRRNAGIGLGRF